MSEIVEVLQQIHGTLRSIQVLLAKPKLADVVAKSQYTISEVAELTANYGITKYTDWTIRYACNEGRIPDANKLGNGQWRLPREVVMRILEEGIPPEQRKAQCG